MTEPELRIEDDYIEIYDTVRDKWHKAGFMTRIDGELYYISRHREILRKWNSLGVSDSILKFIDRHNIENVRFVIGIKKPYRLWDGKVKNFLDHGRPLYARNERGCTLHQELEYLKFMGTGDVK